MAPEIVYELVSTGGESAATVCARNLHWLWKICSCDMQLWYAVVNRHWTCETFTKTVFNTNYIFV